mgnify:FL=1
MSKKVKTQKSKNEKIILVAVAIIASLGIAYMVYDYMTTMEQLDDLKKKSNENVSLTEDSNINSDLGDVDT